MPAPTRPPHTVPVAAPTAVPSPGITEPAAPPTQPPIAPPTRAPPTVPTPAPRYLPVQRPQPSPPITASRASVSIAGRELKSTLADIGNPFVSSNCPRSDAACEPGAISED